MNVEVVSNNVQTINRHSGRAKQYVGFSIPSFFVALLIYTLLLIGTNVVIMALNQDPISSGAHYDHSTNKNLDHKKSGFSEYGQ